MLSTTLAVSAMDLIEMVEEPGPEDVSLLLRLIDCSICPRATCKITVNINLMETHIYTTNIKAKWVDFSFPLPSSHFPFMSFQVQRVP